MGVWLQIVAMVTENAERPEVPAAEQLPGGALSCLDDYLDLMHQCWHQARLTPYAAHTALTGRQQHSCLLGVLLVGCAAPCCGGSKARVLQAVAPVAGASANGLEAIRGSTEVLPCRNLPGGRTLERSPAGCGSCSRLSTARLGAPGQAFLAAMCKPCK